ncbi:MAG: hypothetical protein ACI87H_000609, partial [Gammaproteobacteria bacterium]
RCNALCDCGHSGILVDKVQSVIPKNVYKAGLAIRRIVS